jgi:hypothetical protein
MPGAVVSKQKFLSQPVVATGAPQSVPHRLGRAPRFFKVIPEVTATVPYDISGLSVDPLNVNFTAIPAGAVLRVEADR